MFFYDCNSFVPRVTREIKKQDIFGKVITLRKTVASLTVIALNSLGEKDGGGGSPPEQNTKTPTHPLLLKLTQ